MASKTKQVVVYAKIALIVLVLLALVTVTVKNWSYKTRFWPGADGADVPTLWLMLATCLVSIVLFWGCTKLRNVFKEIVQLRADRVRRTQFADQDRLKRSLDEQERRIDEKIKKALETNNSQD